MVIWKMTLAKYLYGAKQYCSLKTKNKGEIVHMLKTIDLVTLQEIFDTRFNGRSVSAGYKNGNIRIPVTYNNIEMVSYNNGECHLCEEDFPDAPYGFVINTSEVEEIRFDDHSVLPEHTGGQAFIFFKNGDCLDIVADF